ncbi:hypothetical protein HK101_009692 [Irineochytrium annulatum]|nr:hypothetical protein HK101_009692 [Irineochytrium annulatum]
MEIPPKIAYVIGYSVTLIGLAFYKTGAFSNAETFKNLPHVPRSRKFMGFAFVALIMTISVLPFFQSEGLPVADNEHNATISTSSDVALSHMGSSAVSGNETVISDDPLQTGGVVATNPKCQDLYRQLSTKFAKAPSRVGRTLSATNWTVLSSHVKSPISGCHTYKDRYSMYQDAEASKELAANLNDCRPEARSAVAIRVNDVFEVSPDTMLHLRSLIAEVGWLMNHHVYLVVYMGDGDLNHDEQRKRLESSKIPPELWDLCVTYTAREIWPMFPDPVFRDMWRDGHAVLIWFMRTHPQYDYLWSMDDDMERVVFASGL